MGVMNYIQEIKAFYDRLELNPLPPPAIALWHALMHIANKTGWQQEFTVALSLLSLKTGLNATAIKRARNNLVQAGLIEWRQRGGNLSANYKIISIVVQNVHKYEPQTELQSAPQYEPQTEPQSAPINKHKQKEEQKKDTKVSKESRFAPPTLGEVKQYCTDRNNAVNAERFVDFYASKGWMIGKNKMKDWKAAVRTWENKEREKNADGRTGTKPKPDAKSLTDLTLEAGIGDTLFEGF